MTRLLRHLVLIAAGVVMTVPFIWMVSTAFKGDGEIYIYPPTWVPAEIHLENFSRAWDYVPFGRFYVNSIFIAVTVTVCQVFTAALAGYVFARVRFPGRDAIFYMYVATLIVPTQVTMLPLFLIMNELKWIDTYQAMIVPFLASAFIAFFLRQFFSTIPLELEDAAKIDGCGRSRFIWQVLLPLSRPALASIGLFTFLGQWNNYIWPLIITNTTKMRTLPIGLRYFVEESGAQYNLMMAAAMITVAPVVALFFVAQRQFIESIARTGLKS
ncbi:MAG: carbohydrate ABC transporter permease [Anaerolineae bacterium]|nr:carbohydrate ABC transporter permease [Anaerolineae bacterium]